MRKMESEPGNIALWLDKALAGAGLSQAELARQLTDRLGYNLDRSSVSKMVHNQRKVSADELMACVAILGRGLPSPGDAHPPLMQEPLRSAKKGLPRDTTVVACEQTETQVLGLQEDSGDAWIFSPDAEQKSSLYAVDVAGDDMAPRYRPGERVWIDPSKPVKPGGDVFVQRVDAQTKRLATGIIRQFVAWQKDELVLAFCNPGREERYQRQGIIFVHPILFCSRG